MAGAELPTELLERIIFMSRNLNILRSSLRISYRFSSRPFLTELVEAAFAPTWNMRFGDHRAEIILHHGDGVPPDRVPGDPDFQSEILTCPWATASLLLEAQQKWYRRSGSGQSSVLHLEPVSVPPWHRHPPEAPLGDAENVVPLFEKDWDAFKGSCAALVAGSEDVDWTDVGLLLREKQAVYIDLHPSAKIPGRLLTGPFDWEAARTVYWLIRGRAMLGPRDTWSWELTQQGYDHIMGLGNKELALVLLMLLAKMGAFSHWPMFLFEQKLDDVTHQLGHCKTPEDWKLWRCVQTVLETDRNKKFVLAKS
ncbi:hypothetical protein N0V88_003582 [Collariella sp. IMI 366227]|nr:hypothetical protein N0V88_003582 [Collariella sp. IMI 366227]